MANLILIFALALLGVSSGHAEPIQVTALKPVPNYYLTANFKDVNEAMQRLTDGIWSDSWMWAGANAAKSLGWDGRLRTTIEIANTASGPGQLQLHIGKAAGSGVFVPFRADVYGYDGIRYLYLGGAQFDDSVFPGNGASSWLILPGMNAYPKMAIVISIKGRYLMMDEIRWQPSGNSGAQPVEAILPLEKDSADRLKAWLWSADVLAESTLMDWQRTFGAPASWINPTWEKWENVSRFPTAAHIVQQQSNNPVLSFRGLYQDKQAALIGILNPTSTAIGVKIESGSDAFSLGHLQAVLAATGAIVHDPIPAIAPGSVLILPANQATYVWVTADLSKLATSSLNTTLIIKNAQSGEQIGNIPVVLESIRTQLTTPAPRSTTWGYAQEWLDIAAPIWKDAQQALADQLAHGTNIHVISSHNIPQVGALTDQARITRLDNHVNFYKGKGQILLFTGWSVNSPASTDDRLLEWAGWIQNFMTNRGLSNQDWAVYPIDEPNGDAAQPDTKLGYLKTVADILKTNYPAIRIYANPIPNYGGAPLSTEHLRPLANVIDLWQPAYQLFDGSVGMGSTRQQFIDFFTTTGRPWWIFHNTIAPTKSADPLNSYLLIGWRAFQLGASGGGFWSYSDTSYSSAWDDFDSRPGGDWSTSYSDWAVVYESVDGSGGPVTSRRWEAYRQGLQDYGLMHTTRAANGSPVIPQTLPANEAGLNASRAAMLNHLRPDIQPVALTATVSGTAVRVEDRARNAGFGTAAGAFDISYFLSTDTTYDATDIFLCKRSIVNLAPGSEAPQSGTTLTNCAVPSVRAGSYYLIAHTDSGNVIIENNESNNTRIAQVTIKGPDLLPTSFAVRVAGSNKISVSDTVRNQGDTPASEFKIRYYLSTDTTFQAGSDIALASSSGGTRTCSRELSLQGNSSHSANLTCYLPRTAALGIDYYVLVVNDAENKIVEYNETNNTMAAKEKIRW